MRLAGFNSLREMHQKALYFDRLSKGYLFDGKHTLREIKKIWAEKRLG